MPGPWDRPPEQEDPDARSRGSKAGRAVVIGLVLVVGLVVGLVTLRGMPSIAMAGHD